MFRDFKTLHLKTDELEGRYLVLKSKEEIQEEFGMDDNEYFNIGSRAYGFKNYYEKLLQGGVFKAPSSMTRHNEYNKSVLKVYPLDYDGTSNVISFGMIKGFAEPYID